jgi:hypothetical protein
MLKKMYYSLAIAFAFVIAQAQQANAQLTSEVTSNLIGYLQYLPDGYNTNSNNYPVVIALHGIKERGTTSTDVNTIKNSTWTVANVGMPHYIKLGQKYPFIVIAPQLKSSYGTWPPDYVMSVINYVKTKLRIDPRRIYLTGLSLGGYGVWKTAGAYPNVFAAIAPVCSGGNDLTHACAIAASNLPAWAFHGDADQTVSYTVDTKMINAVNNCTPKPNPLAKMTIYPGLTHIIWDKVYKESGVLTWMQQFINGSTPTTTTTTNQLPTVSAGGNKTIYLPTNATTLQGTASDPDGTIAGYQWSKVSGGTVTMSGTTSSKLSTSNMAAGTYTFRLTAKDNKGATKSDDVNVVVASSNKLPVVSAGSDRVIYIHSQTVVGTASDPDGYISAYKWIKLSGPSCSMANTTTPKLWLSSLPSGTYYFRLTVTDNKGATKYDDMKLVVSASTASLSGENTNSLLVNENRSLIASTNFEQLPYRKLLFDQKGMFVMNVLNDRSRMKAEFQFSV